MTLFRSALSFGRSESAVERPGGRIGPFHQGPAGSRTCTYTRRPIVTA